MTKMETNLNEITADWARKIATTEMSDKMLEILNNSLVKISSQAKLNERSVSIPLILPDLVKNELIKRGFGIRDYAVSSNDPRESSYSTISW